MASYFKHLGSESETFTRLIDCFRLRCEDDYVHGAHYHRIYGEGAPGPVFLDFLVKAKTAKMLPDWWNADKEIECMSRALNGTVGWANIYGAVEKSDIIEHYGDALMPMTLRMAAERIYGGGYGMGQMPMPEDYECQC